MRNAHADHSVTHRAEDRLHDHFAHRPHRGHRVGRALTHDGLGCGKSCLLQQRRRVELVDAPLDRARRVHDLNATLLDPVQRVHPVNDLLERSAWDDPRQYGIGIEQVGAFAGQSCRGAACSAEPRDQRLIGSDASGVSARDEGAAQLVGVPTGPRAENDDLHHVTSTAESAELAETWLLAVSRRAPQSDVPVNRTATRAAHPG